VQAARRRGHDPRRARRVLVRHRRRRRRGAVASPWHQAPRAWLPPAVRDAGIAGVAPGAGAARGLTSAARPGQPETRLANAQMAAIVPTRIITTLRAIGAWASSPSRGLLGGRTRAVTLPTAIAEPSARTSHAKRSSPRNMDRAYGLTRHDRQSARCVDPASPVTGASGG